jgi:ABC-type branched-subunit amino acid transport system substrate-binding protein
MDALGNSMMTVSMSRRTALTLLGTPALGALLSACGGGISGLPGLDGGSQTVAPAQPVGPPGAPSGQILGSGKVRIALIVPLTGAGATFGNAMRNAAELALLDFPQPDVQILIKDDRGTPEGAQAAGREAIQEGAELIIGPLFAANVRSVAEIARAANRPVLAFSTDATVAARGVYLLSFLVEVEVDRIISHAVQQGRRSFVAMIPDTPYGKVAEGAFQQTIANRGARAIAIERYQPNQASILEAAGRLAKALPQADALFLPDNAASLPAVGQALSQLGFNPQKTKPVGTGVWNEASVFRIPALQGGWFAAPDSAGFNAFAGRYRAKFSSDPTRNATLAYDAVSLAAALVRFQGAQRFAESTLTNNQGFKGADGIFRFRPDGGNDRGLAILEIRNGVAATVNAAPAEFGAARS